MSIGQAFAGLAASLHVGFFILESFAFPRSKAVQKIFLGRRAENKEIVESASTMMLNQGFYNLFFALGTFFGLYSNNFVLVRYTLYSYVGAGVVLLASTGKIAGSLIQATPAIVALLML